MQSYGSNRDGTALWYAGSRLLERPEKQKLLFVISDGAPNANQYGGTGAKRDLQEDSEKAAAAGSILSGGCDRKRQGSNSGNL